MNEKQNLLVSYAHDIKERKGDKKDILIQVCDENRLFT